ncbi:MAG: hypothetical protein WCM76_14140 [Bacteroidota bacterium]
MKHVLHFLIVCLAFSNATAQTTVSSVNNTQTLNYLVKWSTVTGTPYKIGISSIFDNGNVGIGTNAPTTKLDVNGQIKIRGGSPGAGKILISDATGLGAWQTSPWTIGTGIISTNQWTGIGDLPAETGVCLKVSSQWSYPATSSSHDKTIVRFTNIYGTQNSNTITNWDICSNSSTFMLKKNQSNWLLLDNNNNLLLGITNTFAINSNGNTGIGIINADEKLSVAGNIRLNDSTIYLRYGGDYYHGLGYYSTFGGHSVDGPVLFGFGSGILGITSPQKKAVLRWDNDFVRIDARVTALEVTVQTDVWSDYVLKHDYNLMPIHDLQNYVAEHSHLPEIPSECDITESGLNLGEMQNLQMKKIEELTLYIFTLQQQIDELKKVKN